MEHHKICDVLRDLVSVTIWHLHDHSNECECMLTLFFYIPAIFLCLQELTWYSNDLSNVRMTFKWAI